MSKQIIRIDSEFEKQPTTTVYNLDFNLHNVYEIIFSDKYYVVISDKTTHIDNEDDVEAILYSPENEIKSYNWVNSRIDQVQYILYNWFMNLESGENNIYFLTFERGRSVGGGFL